MEAHGEAFRTFRAVDGTDLSTVLMGTVTSGVRFVSSCLISFSSLAAKAAGVNMASILSSTAGGDPKSPPPTPPPTQGVRLPVVDPGVFLALKRFGVLTTILGRTPAGVAADTLAVVGAVGATTAVVAVVAGAADAAAVMTMVVGAVVAAAAVTVVAVGAVGVVGVAAAAAAVAAVVVVGLSVVMAVVGAEAAIATAVVVVGAVMAMGVVSASAATAMVGATGMRRLVGCGFSVVEGAVEEDGVTEVGVVGLGSSTSHCCGAMVVTVFAVTAFITAGTAAVIIVEPGCPMTAQVLPAMAGLAVGVAKAAASAEVAAASSTARLQRVVEVAAVAEGMPISPTGLMQS